MANKRFHMKQLQMLTVFLSLCLCCCVLILPASAEIRSRGANSVKTSNLKNKQHDLSNLLSKKHTTNNDDGEISPSADTGTTTTSGSAASASASAATTTSSRINTDFMDKLSWKCANNASCLYSLASGIFNSYRRGETVKLGFMDLVKLPKPSTHKTKSKPMETGRSMSQFVDFISGNAIRIPVGPMVFSVQRAEDDDNYIEIALLKKATSTGSVDI